MIKTIGKLSLVTILAGMVIGVPMRTAADDKAPASATPKPKATRFGGKLEAVDKTAKTITVETKTKKRTFEITSDTRIMKSGKPATLDDGVVGEDVGGTYTESADGKMVAKSVRFGKPPERKTATPKKEAPPAK